MPSRPADILLCSPLPLPEPTGGAPDWVHLFPAGLARTVDGRGPFRLDDPAKVISASMRDGRPLPIDESHAIDCAEPEGRPAPARGWIVEMAARPDGIWARVEWTPAGAAAVADRAYRWLSPVIQVTEKGGALVRILRASLTNNPNLVGIASLNAAAGVDTSTETNMDLTKLRTALGLAADADEAAIIAAAEAARAASAQASAHTATLAAIGVAVGAPTDGDATVVLNAVRAAVDPAKVVPAAAVTELQHRLTALTGSIARERAERVVDEAIKAGKVAAPAVMREHYVARHIADPAAVEKELDAMAPIGLQSAQRRADPAAGGDGMSEDERRLVELMGVDPKAFAKARADLAAKEIC